MPNVRREVGRLGLLYALTQTFDRQMQGADVMRSVYIGGVHSTRYYNTADWLKIHYIGNDRLKYAYNSARGAKLRAPVRVGNFISGGSWPTAWCGAPANIGCTFSSGVKIGYGLGSPSIVRMSLSPSQRALTLERSSTTQSAP